MEDSSLKKLLISVIVSPLLMYFEPYSALVKAIGILVVFDIATGVMAARKEGKDITSRSFFKKIPAVALFLIALAGAKEASPALLEFGIEAHQAGKLFCALYALYELLSLLENCGKLGMPIASQITKLLKAKLPTDVKDIVDADKK